MEIELNIHRNTLVIRLSGELDHHVAKQVRLMIERTLPGRNIKNLIFDFSDLTFMDSSGIGMIIGRYKLMKSIGGNVALVCKNLQLKRLVEMSGLTKLITMYTDVNHAISEVTTA
ncbi:MAG: anti-sigma F factor antagonist [Clostridia bacterium]|nr:anti-sigma F factor antagonist [Clostridia bacterium]